MRLLIILSMLFGGISASMGSRWMELPPELDGSMSLYDFSQVERPVLPDSLTPLHICYIARHGARYLSSEEKVKKVEDALNEVAARGSLTRAGKECLALLDKVRKHTAGQWGMLSPVGVAQERRLGEEMAATFRSLLGSPQAKATAVSSYVPRVVETMYDFMMQLVSEYPGIDVSVSSGRQYDWLTRFFVTDKEFDRWRRKGDWIHAYDAFASQTVPAAPAERLVGTQSGLSDDQLRALTFDLYKVLQGMRAMGLPAPTTRWMSEQEYRSCWEAANLEKYYQYSLSSMSTLPGRGASDVVLFLLERFAMLRNGVSLPSFHGIFGHAETLLPIFSLMGLEGSVALPLDPSLLSGEWSDARLTPLGANLEIVCSRGKSGILYASMRLNGRNIAPTSDERMVVTLYELSDYWLRRLASL